MFIRILYLCVILLGCDAVIYRLTESEYARIPPLVQLDSYVDCQKDPDALYCLSQFILVSDKQSLLLDVIQEYSEHYVSHFNHSKIYYGQCVTQNCQEFYKNKTKDLGDILEACLNESMSEKYDLKVKLTEKSYCETQGIPPKNVDQLDTIVGVICVILLIVNIVGSLLDYCSVNKENNKVSRFLLCFSLLSNWKKLTTMSKDFKDPRLNNLRSFDAIRVISTCAVVNIHGLVIIALTSANTQFIEEMYVRWPFQFFLATTLIMVPFFILTSFLLIYHLLIKLETETFSWYILPNRIVLRWLRLTPAYAFALALTATWIAYIPSGALWGHWLGAEMKDCRQYWWQNMLYFQNYLKPTLCMLHCWSLAVEMQLYCLSVLVFVTCRTPRSLKIVLTLLIIAGIVVPAAHVYFEDLDGIQMFSPEIIRNAQMKDRNFVNVYIRSHTNVIGYAIGISMAYLVYYWQKQKVDFKKYQRPIFRALYWSTFPLMLCCWYSVGIFYSEGPRQSLYTRVLYAAFIKGIFGLMCAVLMVGCIFKFEDFYRGILEWRGWKIPNELVYSSYIMHNAIVKVSVIVQEGLITTTVMSGFKYIAALMAATYIAGLFFWLLVEAPFKNIIQEFVSKTKLAESRKGK